MAFTLIQAGASLYSLNTEGGQSAALTLPTGVTLSSVRVPRFARFRNFVVVVNTPSRPITVDVSGVCRVLTPSPPASALVLSNTNGGALTGTYTAKQTFLLLDASHNVIAESDFGPVSNTFIVTADYLTASGINLSTDAVQASRLYRTTDLGTTYFPWIDLDGNINTSVSDDLSDAALGLVAAPTLGTAPDLTLICEWAGRLWGVGRTDGDNLRWTEAGTMYGWAGENTLPIPHVGDDRYGITALMPRRDSLGVGRRNQIIQIPSATDNTDIRPVIVKENCGVVSQESVQVFRDAALFLSLDGVYMWDDNGVVCMSDQGKVRSWFTTDTYFNRGMFSQAFSTLDAPSSTYRLFLCSAGSVIPDRWVELDLDTGKWFGPHKTDAFSPSCGLTVRGTNDQQYAMVGSRNGYVSQDTQDRSDWAAVPIPVDIVTKRFTGGNPDHETFFGQPSIFTEPTSGSVSLIPIVGGLKKTTPGVTKTIDLSKSRQRVGRLGTGRHAQLEFTQAQLGSAMVLHGFIIPTADVGRR